MKKILISTLIAIFIIILCVFLYIKVIRNSSVSTTTPNNTDTTEPTDEIKQANDPRDISYTIEGTTFVLVNGFAETEITADASTKQTLSVFGRPSFGDIDGDGDDDALVLLEHNPGGSGLFYYVALAINTNGVYQATNTTLLGDRIAPQTFSIEGTQAIVNYMTRLPAEDFSVQPSVGKSLYLQVDPGTLELNVSDHSFENSTDQTPLTLGMKTWTWIQSTDAMGTTIVPTQTDAFTLTFMDDGTFQATTDCNTMGGSYTVDEDTISLNDLFSTKMFCQDSQEQVFASMLDDVQAFSFTPQRELVLSFLSDKGTMLFRK